MLLGASNLSLGFREVLAAASRQLGGGPFETHVAAGLGRSYGRWSMVLGRGLPGIVDCGLWRAVSRPAAGPTYLLLSDIGNDIAYGASPETISGWVATCLDRLAESEPRAALVLPPTASVAALRRWQFLAVRTLLFPGRRISLDAARAATEELADRLRRLAGERGVPVAEPRRRWYGFDAIHVRRRVRREVWREVLAGWGPPPVATSEPPRAPRLPARASSAAERRTLLGVELARAQPRRRLADGTTLAFY